MVTGLPFTLMMSSCERSTMLSSLLIYEAPLTTRRVFLVFYLFIPCQTTPICLHSRPELVTCPSAPPDARAAPHGISCSSVACSVESLWGRRVFSIYHTACTSPHQFMSARSKWTADSIVGGKTSPLPARDTERCMAEEPAVPPPS